MPGGCRGSAARLLHAAAQGDTSAAPTPTSADRLTTRRPAPLCPAPRPLCPQARIEQAEAGGCPDGLVSDAKRQLHRLLLAEVRAELDAVLKLSGARGAEKSVAQRLSSLKVGAGGGLGGRHG